MKHATLLLFVAVVTSSALADGPPPARGDAAYARPLHKLTEAEADRLDRRRALFYVRGKYWFTSESGQAVCWCESPDGMLVAVMRMRRGQKHHKVMVVEATFEVDRRPAQVIDGVQYDSFTEYRLEDAVRK